MPDKKAKAGEVASRLNERLTNPKKGKEYKGKHIDNRRVDGSLPRFLYKKEGENYYYSLLAVDWLAFMGALRDSNHKGATYQNIKDIFEAALNRWGEEEALDELQKCFTQDFPRFLRNIFDEDVRLSSELEGFAAPSSLNPKLPSQTP